MGLCLSKLPGGSAGSTAVLHHAPSPPKAPSNAPSVMQPVSPPIVSTSAPPVTAKSKNLVAPQPTASSPKRQNDDMLLQQASSTRSLGATQVAATVDDRAASDSSRMQRSQSLSARNSSKRLASGSDDHALAAAAESGANTATASVTTDSSLPPPPSLHNMAAQEASSGSANVRRHMSLQPAQQHTSGSARLGLASPPLQRRLKQPAVVSLETLLLDERVRIGFFTYLQHTALQEKLRDGESVTANNDNDEARLSKRRMSKLTSSRTTSDYREDCVLFWLEMSDLLKIPSGGTFHLGLMHDLFTVYIAHGALRQLPMVSAAEREPLAQFLENKQSDRALLALKMLLLDVLEVATSHFDDFVRCDSSLGYAYVARSATTHNVLARLATGSSSLNSTTGDRRVHVYEIVATPALSRIFRAFLAARNSVETLLFIVDALAFEDLVHSFTQSADTSSSVGVHSPDAAHHDHYCQRQAQKIFTKYLRFGSKAEICVSGAVKETLLRALVEPPPIPADVFSDAVLVCSAELVHSHLDAFYSSSAYVAYKASRSSADRARRKATQARASTMRLGSSDTAASTRSGSRVTESDNGDGGNNDDDGANSGPLLREILDGPGASFWRAFLQENGRAHALLFVKDVSEFQRVPHGQRQYIESQARKLFDKFVRRGAKLELELPADVRRDILYKLAAPTEHTFADAQRFVLETWERTDLVQFRRHRLHAEMLAALAKLPHNGTSGSGSSGSNTDSDKNKASSLHATSSSSSSNEFVDVSKLALREFLDVDVLRRRFRLFLEKEQCAHELFFYCDVQGFQQFPTSDYLARQAKKLCARFCDPASRECVALSPTVHAELLASLKHPSPAMFNRAQDEVLAFFTTTLFPKFQQSELYRTLRITHAELRHAQLAAHGDSIASSDNRTHTASSSSSFAARARGSVVAVPADLELREDQVTVQRILEHHETRALFLFFAEEIFCTESIYFWLDCNEFKDIPHTSYLKLRAQKIYRKYIAGHAKLQVNVESAVIHDIVAHLDHPSRMLFVPAQLSITKMLERDTLPKFRRSKHFQPCLQLLRQDAKAHSIL